MKGWLDNFGKADNANDSNINLPEGFVGIGYDTKGRNYSPAWGGQFQYGGIIPIAQSGVTEYMNKKMQDKKDATIAKEYNLPEVVVEAPYLTKYNDPNKPTGFPQYTPKPEGDPNSPGFGIAEFYKSWVSSPEYERRMKNTGYYETPLYNGSRQSSIGLPSKSTLHLSYNDYLEDVRSENMEGLGNTQKPGFITMEPALYMGRPASRYTPWGIEIHPDHAKNPETLENVMAHEIAHAIDSDSSFERQLISNAMLQGDAFYDQPQFYSEVNPATGNRMSNQKDRIREAMASYVRNDPQEFKSDLNALRFLMFDKGIYDIRKGKEFTKEDLERAKEKLKGNESLERSIDAAGESGFIKLMNIIAKGKEDVIPVAMGGMSIPGSVGFTYARTAGSAPSEGKYAKKTMASAQIGKNVKKDETNIDTNIANKIAGFELQQNPEYQYWKYLQSQPQLRQAPGRGEELMRQGLGYADVATDVMQMGNFIPHPIAQAVGKVGNIAGMIVDGLQGADDAYRGNYLSAGINFGSAVLPSFLGANTFRRPAMMLRPGDPLYPLTEQARRAVNSPINLTKSSVDYIEPFTKVKGMTNNSLLWNRGLLGALGAETAYDAGLIGPVKKEYGGEIPSAQNGIMSPMLLARNVLNYFYPSEEATSTVAAAPVEYRKGLTDELLKRQAYKESTFNPAAVSPAGYKGLTQIGEGVLEDYSKKKGGKKLDPFNPKDAVELQKFAMGDLYNAGFINKPNQSDSVRIAKTLAAYNWGRGNLYDYLGEQKKKGVDIYNSYDWLNDLPKETSDYVNKILLQEDPSFNKNYKKASTNPKYEEVTSLYDQKKFGGDIPSAQKGKNDVEKISINDPRYPEMYKNRQVGLSYDDAISLPDLPEVVITAPRSYTMDSLRDFTTAALYGIPENLTKLEQVPTAALAETAAMLAGKPYDFSNVNPNLGQFGSNQRDLSVLGYENPEGFAQNAVNFGLSMIDPALIAGGASMLRKSLQKKLINSVSKNFQSEIDWSKWNPETPNYPELINEYNAIEETTKKAGTWMKNSDGSEFQGTPEQFVQQQSSHFKKAYPEGYNEVYRGVSANTSFANLNESTNPRLRGPRGIFTANEQLAKDYITLHQLGDKKETLTPFDKDNTPGLFELIYPKGKQITRYSNLDGWLNIDLGKTPNKESLKSNIENLKKSVERQKRIGEELYANNEMPAMAEMHLNQINNQEKRINQLQKYYDDFDNIKNDEAAFNKMRKALGDQTTTDDIAAYIPKTNLRSITLQDIIDGGSGDVTIVNNRPGNYLKSKVGNVGFFDLKNPNIYKGVIPAGIATALSIDQQKNGGNTPSAQNGQEMKFYQNGLDWKPKSMQPGGELPLRVSTADPRYPELYKNRQVGSYYDGAYTLPDLPEVVVTGKDERIKEGMSQGSGRFLEGALGVISAPQVVTMDWLTGKQQTPSEAWGFQNPGGWLDSPTAFGKNALNFGMDMTFDPLNALGVGVVDDAIKIGAKSAKTFLPKAISQAPSPQMMADNVAASATPNVSTVSNPTGLPNTGNRELLEKLKQETIDRLSTSEGKRRLQRMIDKNFSKNNEGWGKPVEGWGEFFLEGLKNLELSGVKKMTPDDIIEDLKKLELLDKVEELSDWDAGFNRIDGTPVLYVGKKYSPYDYDVRQIFSHEIDGHFNQRHTATDLDDKLSKLELKDQADPPNLDADLEDVQPSIFGSLPSVSDFKTSMNYFLKGSKGREKLAFASEVRRNLFERGITKSLYDTLTPEILKKHFELYNKTGGDKYTLRLYELMKNSPKNFKILSEVLNDLPAVALPVAGGAAAVTSGLNQNQPEQKQKNGGITKDNKGYWNPDNWGKPVEIDSNMITMQGVYEPLLGISDTGDTKLMKPGKNYKFKGKKVTEFPVAELGINQLDAQPMKKLNQLLNFTNNPDKDNWLDKYN
jgi:hypothetical protein